jgi:hypothetical protein
VSDDGKVTLGKGRATPKRSEAQKRRGGPVPPPPANRREAAKRLREQATADRKAGRTTSPDRLLKRDAGPVREMVRDMVDGRRNVATLMLPLALLYVVVQLLGNSTLFGIAARVFTIGLLVVIGDSLATGWSIRSRIRSVFPGERPRGHVGYGLLRTTVFRRLRMPPPRVKPAPLLKRR